MSRLRTVLALASVFLLLAIPHCLYANSYPAVGVGASSSFNAIATDQTNVVGVGGWEIDFGTTATSTTPNGWSVTLTGTKFTVTAPSGATVSNHTVCKATSVITVDGVSGPGGPEADFQVVPIRPNPHPGSAFSWEGSIVGVNLATFNKLTSIPLVSWTARGGLPVAFTLNHSSQSTRNASEGQKWINSYEIGLVSDPTSHNVTVTWGDEQPYTFAYYTSGLLAPSGINDKLVANGSPVTSYDLTNTNQTKYHFVSAGGNNWRLSTITDENANTITINYNGSGQVSTIVDPTSRTITLGYTSGLLTSVTDPLSRQWTIQYDGSNNLTQINFPSLNGVIYNVQLAYNASHNLTSFTDKRGNTTAFGYQSGGNNLGTITDPLGNVTTFVYHSTFSQVTDANGNNTNYNYSASHLVSVVDPLSNTSRTYYDGYNNVTSSQDKRGHTTTYGSYTSNGLALSVTDPLSHTTSKTYTATNKVATSTDGNSNVTTYGYDGNDNLTSVQDALTHTTTTTIGTYGLPSAVTDALSHSTTFGYDTNGYTNSVTDANSNTTTSVYNALGWQTSVTDALSHTTTNSYDNWGQVYKVTATDGSFSTIAHDVNGNVIRTSDANAAPANLNGGATWIASPWGSAVSFDGTTGYARIYDPAPLKITGPISFSVRIKASSSTGVRDIIGKGPASSPTGEIFLRINNGNYEVGSVDSSGVTHMTSITGATADLGNWIHLVGLYDGTAWKLYRENALISTTTDSTGAVPVSNYWNIGGTGFGRYFSGIIDDVRIYNRALTTGEISALYSNPPATCGVSNGLVGYWSFDENGGTFSNDLAHSTINTYDADNRLVKSVNARQEATTYTYDSTGKKGLLSSKTDGNGHVTSYNYTTRNEVSQVTYPDSSTESWTYDANGNMANHTKPDGTVIAYVYDNADRLTTIDYPTGTDVGFTYDAGNRRTGMTDSSGSTTWAYDVVNRLTSFTNPQGTVSYGYDNANRKTTRTLSTATWTYGYDAGNRLTSMVSPYSETNTFTYDAANRLIRKDLGNGGYDINVYDNLDRAIDVRHYNASSVFIDRYQYTFDAIGNTLTRTDNDGTYTTFLYDGTYQLAGETRSGYGAYDERYTYDHNQNRLTKTLNGVTDTYAYDSHDHLLTTTSGRTYTYDAQGNTASLVLGSNTYGFTYDYENRLKSETINSVTQGTYTYNGLGLRVGRTESSGTYPYICDGTEPGSQVLNDGVALYSDGISEHRSTGSQWYLGDSLGSTRVQTNTSSAVTYSVTFDAFGLVPVSSGTTSSPFQFVGQSNCQKDNSGLVLMGNRYYDATIGRFISEDPIGDGDNWYAYCENNPANGTDPTGLVYMPAGHPVPTQVSRNGGFNDYSWINASMERERDAYNQWGQMMADKWNTQYINLAVSKLKADWNANSSSDTDGNGGSDSTSNGCGVTAKDVKHWGVNAVTFVAHVVIVGVPSVAAGAVGLVGGGAVGAATGNAGAAIGGAYLGALGLGGLTLGATEYAYQWIRHPKDPAGHIGEL